MTKQIKTAGEPTAKRRITIERTYQASIEDVWELWTTKEGIESWWGPGRFLGEGSQHRPPPWG